MGRSKPFCEMSVTNKSDLIEAKHRRERDGERNWNLKRNKYFGWCGSHAWGSLDGG